MLLDEGQRWKVVCGDALAVLRTLPDCSVHCCVTSPPYFALRDYGCDGQIGLEATPEAYVARLVEVFREVRRVLRDDGTLWVNIGDSYANTGNKGQDFSASSVGYGGRGRTILGGQPVKAIPSGLKPKDRLGIPHLLVFALRADGWYWRDEIVWEKPNPMPESVQDRCTKSHEFIFLLSKQATYYFDAQAVAEPSTSDFRRGIVNANQKVAGLEGHETKRAHSGWMGGKAGTRNKRSVWTVATKPYKGSHFACYPPALIEPCILAGCPWQCCTACGTPWVRVTEKERVPTRPGENGKVLDHLKLPAEEPGRASGTARFDKSTLGQVISNRDPQRHCTKTVTTGWQPTCTCGAAITSGIVLDPFAGSGTTGQVAVELGRRAYLIELNPKYIKLIGKRMAKAQPPLPGCEPTRLVK